MENALCWMTVHKIPRGKQHVESQKDVPRRVLWRDFRSGMSYCWSLELQASEGGAAAAAHINKCRHLAEALRNFRDQNDFGYVIAASYKDFAVLSRVLGLFKRFSGH